MAVKIITKQMHERLDSFIQNVPANNIKPLEVVANEQQIVPTKKTLKKTDGLIERIDSKIFITEDNRQLLQD